MTTTLTFTLKPDVQTFVASYATDDRSNSSVLFALSFLVVDNVNPYLFQCHRLDGGLSKLLAASEQLKELNEKLEIQKVAVTEKSEACEKLLLEIQRATEQANEKKAMAVGKREEIAEQNKEIVVEKAEAEEALAQALPALEEAKLALQDLDKSDVTEIR